MTKPKEELEDYPPKPPVKQLTLEEVRRLTPEGVEAARHAGALRNLMGGKPPEPEEST
jgi:hypothetical protein